LHIDELSSFRVKKVVDATHHISNGDHYHINVIFETKGKDVSCAIDIWERGWIEQGGSQSKIFCKDINYNLIAHQPVLAYVTKS